MGHPVSSRQPAGPEAGGDWATENRLRFYTCRDNLWKRSGPQGEVVDDHNFAFEILVGFGNPGIHMVGVAFTVRARGFREFRN